MSVPPQGVGPRGTLPLGLCPVDSSPFASRHAKSACRATARPPALDLRALRQAPELPEFELSDWECLDGLDSEQESEPEPATVEPHRSAQGWGDVAPAPRAPVLPAPMRLCGHGSAPSFAPLASLRPSGSVAALALLTTLGAVALVVVTMTLRARHEGEQFQLRQELELHAAQRSPAPSTPEPAPPAVLTPGPANAPTSTALAATPARAASTARAARPATPAIPVTSDIVDPWRHR